MKKREMDKILKSCFDKTGKRLDPEKVDLLSDDIKDCFTCMLVRKRAPIIKNLISERMSRSWMASCGYLYVTESVFTGFTFYHTCEHIVI